MKANTPGAREIKCFHSRRNRVSLNEMESNGCVLPVVVKKYPDMEAASREYRLLKELSSLGINVPTAYGMHGNVLYLQYIEGTLLTHIIDDVSSFPARWIAGLAGWFYKFHRANSREDGSVMLKDDANLRNFIFYENSAFYALDFEAEVFGRPERDISECCAYILSNNPPFTTEKFAVVNKFIDCYCKLDDTAHKGAVKEEIKKSLKTIAGYRQQQEDDILASLPLVDCLVE
jgi:tRNA A-37 threonylcarbamoyl transferase component Bud32